MRTLHADGDDTGAAVAMTGPIMRGTARLIHIVDDMDR